MRKFSAAHLGYGTALVIALAGLLVSVRSYQISQESLRIARQSSPSPAAGLPLRPQLVLEPLKDAQTGLYLGVSRHGAAILIEYTSQLKNIGRATATAISLPQAVMLGEEDLIEGIPAVAELPAQFELAPGQVYAFCTRVRIEVQKKFIWQVMELIQKGQMPLTVRVELTYGQKPQGPGRYHQVITQGIFVDRVVVGGE